MKSTGIVRPLDQLGRIVLPIELRKNLCIEDYDALEFYKEDDGKIVLRKYQPACIFCGNARDTIKYNNKIVCKECIGEL